MWIICFSLSVLIFISAIAFSLIKRKGNDHHVQFLRPINILLIGVFLSGVLTFFPIYWNYFEQTNLLSVRFIEALLLAIHNTIRLFVIDSDFELVQSSISGLTGFLPIAYPVFTALIYLIAPLLTFGFILSFFKNLKAYVMYLFSYRKDVYIFSGLNEYSINLAMNIRENHKKASIIFTDVYPNDDEKSIEQLESVKSLGAICFKKDLTLINFKFHSKKNELFFFILNEKEDDNIRIFTHLNKTYKNRDLTEIYLFSRSVLTNMVLSDTLDSKIKIRRINYAESLINNTLYKRGHELFDSARQDKDGKKVISAVIVGLGNYGTTITKTLAWYCQMDGYKIKINAFDKNKQAKSIFSSSCPELMDEKYNNVEVDGEAYYSINIHSKMDYTSSEFDEKISQIDDATFVFVNIGSDQLNMDCAVKLRMLFERKGIHPTINAVIYNSDHKKAIENAKNFKGQSYDIHCIGDTKSTYSEKIILDSELEKAGLNVHLSYTGNKPEGFWNFEYNYRSSIASAIHLIAKKHCNISGINKKPEDRSVEERNIIETLEHKRWNAYMRSEGYIYSPNRNDLAKTHHDLVNFEQLDEDTKRIDGTVCS